MENGLWHARTRRCGLFSVRVRHKSSPVLISGSNQYEAITPLHLLLSSLPSFETDDQGMLPMIDGVRVWVGGGLYSQRVRGCTKSKISTGVLQFCRTTTLSLAVHLFYTVKQGQGHFFPMLFSLSFLQLLCFSWCFNALSFSKCWHSIGLKGFITVVCFW